MLTYLIILLDDTSSSYCHYDVTRKERKLIGLDVLKRGIIWAMKENLNIQFVYPDYDLPDDYKEVIETIDHTKIKPSCLPDGADVIILNDWHDEVPEGATCIIRCSRLDLSEHLVVVNAWLSKLERLNIVLTDVGAFTDEDIYLYKETLERLADMMVKNYRTGKNVQLNLLTDRLTLTNMNNCNAGDTNVTLAPNGRFYLCPAFYYEDEQQCVGNLDDGLDIKNHQLLKLDHAPICRVCDAYQCRRCIWMNGRLTMDNNTPSHQQCVIAHLERNASHYLQSKMEEVGIRLIDSYPIEEMTELDPFNLVNRWK